MTPDLHKHICKSLVAASDHDRHTHTGTHTHREETRQKNVAVQKLHLEIFL